MLYLAVMEFVSHHMIPGFLMQPSRVRAAQATWIAFVLVQALDGAMTLIGMHTFGLDIEANPLISWYAYTFGPAIAVSAAKLFAVGCGIALYLTARYRTIAVLACAYLLCAVGPWVHLLWRTDW